jgi:exonuclease VII small subunit
MEKVRACQWCDSENIKYADSNFFYCFHCGCCGKTGKNYEDALKKWNKDIKLSKSSTGIHLAKEEFDKARKRMKKIREEKEKLYNDKEAAYKRAAALGIDEGLIEKNKDLNTETFNMCLDVIESYQKGIANAHTK